MRFFSPLGLEGLHPCLYSTDTGVSIDRYFIGTSLKLVFASQNDRIHGVSLLKFASIRNNLAFDGMRQTLKDLSLAEQLLFALATNLRYPSRRFSKTNPFGTRLVQLPQTIAERSQLLDPNHLIGFVADKLVDGVAKGSFLHKEMRSGVVWGGGGLSQREKVVDGDGKVELSLLLHQQKDYIPYVCKDMLFGLIQAKLEENESNGQSQLTVMISTVFSKSIPLIMSLTNSSIYVISSYFHKLIKQASQQYAQSLLFGLLNVFRLLALRPFGLFSQETKNSDENKYHNLREEINSLHEIEVRLTIKHQEVSCQVTEKQSCRHRQRPMTHFPSLFIELDNTRLLVAAGVFIDERLKIQLGVPQEVCDIVSGVETMPKSTHDKGIKLIDFFTAERSPLVDAFANPLLNADVPVSDLLPQVHRGLEYVRVDSVDALELLPS